MIVEGDHQRAWKDGREARKPDRLHWPRSGQGKARTHLPGLPSLRPEISCRQSRRSTSTIIVLPRSSSDDVPVFALASGAVVRLDHGTHRHQLARWIDFAAPFPVGMAGALDHRRRGWQGDAARMPMEPKPSLRGPARKWVGGVAAGPQDAVAFSEGRAATVLLADGSGAEHSKQARTIEGLAFAPKGLRLAMARYNGVALAFVQGSAPPHRIRMERRTQSGHCSVQTAGFW
jgi:hypothetical protein